MRLLSFVKVGPSEHVAWWRGHCYVVTQRGDRWLASHDGTAIGRPATESGARVIALEHVKTVKPR
jgi:hypothetical protein